tara:strand:- start:176 stop:280 length:105 start_codon:yes stop_codon:yes gene_type:complete
VKKKEKGRIGATQLASKAFAEGQPYQYTSETKPS